MAKKALTKLSLRAAILAVFCLTPTCASRAQPAEQPVSPVEKGDAALAGAKCDGVTDDSAAINATIAKLRAGPAAGKFGWPIGHSGRLTLPGGKCLIKSTLNFTHLYGSGFAADLWGSQILCQTRGKPCIDATGTGQISILGLNLNGDCATNTPNFGLVLARPTPSLSAGADHNYIDHPTITGCFRVASYYNRSSETTMINAASFYNFQDHAYAAIWDGSNFFDFQSEFVAAPYAAGTFSSFNENTCDTCLFESFGKGAVPLWIGGAVRHKFVNGYVLAQAADGGPAIVLSFENNAPNDFLDLDIHFENKTLGSLILIKGARNPVIHGLRLNDPMPFQSGPIFKREFGVKTLTVQDAELHIGILGGNSPGWWDEKAAYDISGMIYSQDKRFEDPGQMSGLVCAQAKCSTR